MYHPGDYKVICDQCGITYLRSECSTDWKNRIVCDRGCWEPRHPQEFVRAKPDITRVADARPDVSYDSAETTLSASASILATLISIASGSSLAKYDSIGIEMDNYVIHWTFLTSAPGGTRTVSDGRDRTTSTGSTRTTSFTAVCEIYEPLPYAATSGNTVYLPSVSGATFLNVNEITEASY